MSWIKSRASRRTPDSSSKSISCSISWWRRCRGDSSSLIGLRAASTAVIGWLHPPVVSQFTRCHRITEPARGLVYPWLYTPTYYCALYSCCVSGGHTDRHPLLNLVYISEFKEPLGLVLESLTSQVFSFL